MTAFKFGQKRKKVDDLQIEKAENGSDFQTEKAENGSDLQIEKAENGSELQASNVEENECSKSCVCAKNLTVKYGEKVIFENLNIEFAKDKINVILGSSGVGKTTLLNVLAGLKEFDGTLEGADGNVSYIFQKDRLIPTISVYKNLDLVLKAKIKDKHERKKLIIDMLEMLEISDLIDVLPTKISGGQAQRVALARAFLFPSKILLMDEPFRALDTALKSRLLMLLSRLNLASPRTVVYVTHAIDECLLAADKYFVLASTPATVALSGDIEMQQDTRTLKDSKLESARQSLLNALF